MKEATGEVSMTVITIVLLVARECFSIIYDEIDLKCKPSRETSLALTKLEEAQFWAIKGITREEK